MGKLLSEEDGDGGFSFIAWKRRIVICSKVHAVSAVLEGECPSLGLPTIKV
jgi:hypothetical protein